MSKQIRYQRSGGKVITLPKPYNVNELTGQIRSGGVEISFVGGQLVVNVPEYK